MPELQSYERASCRHCDTDCGHNFSKSGVPSSPEGPPQIPCTWGFPCPMNLSSRSHGEQPALLGHLRGTRLELGELPVHATETCHHGHPAHAVREKLSPGTHTSERVACPTAAAAAAQMTLLTLSDAMLSDLTPDQILTVPPPTPFEADLQLSQSVQGHIHTNSACARHQGWKIRPECRRLACKCRVPTHIDRMLPSWAEHRFRMFSQIARLKHEPPCVPLPRDWMKT